MSGRRAGCPGLPETPDVRALGPDVQAGRSSLVALWNGEVRISGLGVGCPGARERPDVRAGELFSVFFRRRFHASLADGVVVPWRLHSSLLCVVFRQDLCMHTSGVSRSIPSSKGSSEHM